MIKFIVGALAVGCAVGQADARTSAPSKQWARPNVHSMSPGNAAGVLQYCVSKQLVRSTSAEPLIERLTKKPEVTKLHDFAAGASGHIVGKQPFSIGNAPAFIQSEACDSVLRRAKEFHVTG